MGQVRSIKKGVLRSIDPTHQYKEEYYFYLHDEQASHILGNALYKNFSTVFDKIIIPS